MSVRVTGALAVLLLLGSLASSAAHAAETGGFAGDEVRAARKQLLAELADATDRDLRNYRIAMLALVERPEGVYGEAVRQVFEEEVFATPSTLTRVFLEGDDTARRTILELFMERWDILGRGTNAWRREMIRIGLSSDNPDTRVAAARLAARRPIAKTGHILVDAAHLDPRLTQAALMALGANRDPRPLRWALDYLAHDDPRLSGTARWSVRRIGRAAADIVRERIETAADAETAAAAVDALLLIASEDDVSVLYSWLESATHRDEELVDRVTDALAGLEIGNYRPPDATRPELEFFVPGSS